MRIQPLGPEGVRQRIEQIQAKLDSIQPPGVPSAPLASATTSGLTGPIGSGGTGSIAPMNPFGPGMRVAAPVAPPELRSKILEAAQAANLDPALFEAMVGAESSFNPNSVSKAGAKGLAQLMPETARLLGVTNPFDPDQNLQAGAKYLGQMMAKFGDPKLALAAYNAGPGAVQRYGGIPPFPETRQYVDRVMTRAALLRQGG